MASPNIAQFLDVSIRNRSKILFEGKVQSLTSYNEVGEFDILPQHANFITLIKKAIIIDKGSPGEKKFEVKSGGLMNVEQEQIDIYLGI